MGITAKMRKDMLDGIDVELNRYKRLWSAGRIAETDQPKVSKAPKETEEPYSQKMVQLASKLEGAGIDVMRSRSFARQAIAAYPEEEDINVLFCYAMELQKAVDQK